jgi:hypothetical protein
MVELCLYEPNNVRQHSRDTLPRRHPHDREALRPPGADYVAQTIRANFPVLGLTDGADVIPLRRAKKA